MRWSLDATYEMGGIMLTRLSEESAVIFWKNFPAGSFEVGAEKPKSLSGGKMSSGGKKSICRLLGRGREGRVSMLGGESVAVMRRFPRQHSKNFRVLTS